MYMVWIYSTRLTPVTPGKGCRRMREDRILHTIEDPIEGITDVEGILEERV